MDSIDNQEQASPQMTAGQRLRTAREAAGLSRSDIASQTKVAERHLLAIEEDRFGDLAARTYAVGFARTYARALGLDEAEIAAVVREQLDAADIEKPEVAPSFEPGDPARVPPARLAWIAAGGAVLVIALLLVFWGSFLSPEGKLPDLLSKPAPVASKAAPAAAPAPQRPVDQTVVLTATDDNVWLSVKDEAGQRLFEKTMVKGESWTVPTDAKGAKLRTGRPDALRVTVGGKAIPALSEGPRTVSGVSLAPADLLALGGTTPAPTVPPVVQPAVQQAANTGAPTPAASAAPSPRPTTASPRPAPTTAAPRPAPATSRAAPAAPATSRPAPAPQRTPATATSAPAPRATSTPVPSPQPQPSVAQDTVSTDSE